MAVALVIPSALTNGEQKSMKISIKNQLFRGFLVNALSDQL